MKKKKRAKRKGPAPRAGQTATVLIAVRLTVKERAAIRRGAKAAGLELSSFVREASLRAAARKK